MEATRTIKNKKHSKLLFLGYLRPIEELRQTAETYWWLKGSPSSPLRQRQEDKRFYTFRQCGHRANVLSEISVHWKKGARANKQQYYKSCQAIQREEQQWAACLSPTRNTLEQCPQMTRMPTGCRCGSGLSLLMWTGPRLMVRLLGGEKKELKLTSTETRPAGEVFPVTWYIIYLVLITLLHSC